MNYEELKVVEIGKAEDVVLGWGASLDCDNEILLTQYPVWHVNNHMGDWR